jgi:hypothetical protein
MSARDSMAIVEQAGAFMAGGFTGPGTDLFADDFAFHYFNTQLPDLAGDYQGLDGMRGFFMRLHQASGGTFSVEPVSLTPFGDELVAAHAIIRLSLRGADLELDALFIWRVFGGQVHEAWDIPAVNTTRRQARSE